MVLPIAMDATLAISLPKVACKFGHLLSLPYFFDEKTEEPLQKRQLVQTAPTLPSKSPLSLSQIRTGVRYAFVCLFGGEPSTSKLMPAMEWVYPSLEWHCKNVQPQWPLDTGQVIFMNYTFKSIREYLEGSSLVFVC